MAEVKLLNVSEVAEILGIAVRSVWRLSATGQLPPPIRIGARCMRWRLADIERRTEELATDAQKKQTP